MLSLDREGALDLLRAAYDRKLWVGVWTKVVGADVGDPLPHDPRAAYVRRLTTLHTEDGPVFAVVTVPWDWGV